MRPDHHIVIDDLTIHILPVMTDNYCYLLEKQGQALVVDPGTAKTVLSMIAAHRLTLTDILLTHDHFDHTGGCRALLQKSSCRVSGAANSHQADISNPVSDNDSIVWAELQIIALSTPGHTAHDICWYFPEQQALFTGDTLFAGGCGRVFSGEYSRMRQSLERIASLPPATQIFPGHEYTSDNLAFAHYIEPGNAETERRLTEIQNRHRQGMPPGISTVGLERQTNPFLRSGHPSLKAAVDMASAEPDEVFTYVRRRKDRF